MRKILLILLGFVLLSCTDGDYTTTPSATLMADKPVKINYNQSNLFVYPVNINSTSVRWGGFGSELVGAASDFDGEINSDSIVSHHGSGSYSAYLCDTMTAYGFTDWYLPSKNELNAVYNYFTEHPDFFDNTYWSSTEYSKDSVYVQDFSSGIQYVESKTSYEYVICIRKDD